MGLDRVAILAVAVGAVLAAGCQSPDVGARCQIPSDPNSTLDPTPSSIYGDYLETGNLACDSLVCIVSRTTSGEYATCDGTNCGYCSKPCVSDTECYKSETGLVCRQMVLDPEFIQILEETNPELADRYLGDARYSSYCAVPLE